jgi:membrane-bound inhibitor of C-type lysozyme
VGGGALLKAKINKFSGFSRGIDDDFDARTRPRNFLKDKEGLYDDAIKLKKANNILKTENLKYKTKVKKLEAELVNQQREMDEYIMSQNQGRMDYGLNNSYMKNAGSHITQNLKGQVKDLRIELKKKDEEMVKLKKSLK